MSELDLSVTIAGIKMKNPLTVGSGTYGHHGHFSQFFPVETMGVLVPKTIRAYSWPGNPAPRVYETPAGLHTSVGIPCNTWEHFLDHDVPILSKLPIPIIQSVIGRTEEEYVDMVGRCSDLGIFAGIELNLSCPNLKQGGTDFGYDPEAAYSVVKNSKRRSRVPIFAKLAPDYTSLIPVAKAVERAGADAISMINAPRAMCIDYKTRKPIIGNKIGALSGPAIKSMAVYMIWEVYRAISIPVIGMGGVADYKDVVEFMAAGATAVAFGTVSYVDPMALPRALIQLSDFCGAEGITDIKELIGSAHETSVQASLSCNELVSA